MTICKVCGKDTTCTNPYKEFKDKNGQVQDTRTEFSQWLTRLQHPFCSKCVDCNNLDFIWFRYDKGWFITIEEKRYGKKQNRNQFESQRIMRDMLLFASNHDDVNVKTDRGKQAVYNGHYLIIFENTNPDDSKSVCINGSRYSDVEIAIKYLLYYGEISSTLVEEYKSKRKHNE